MPWISLFTSYLLLDIDRCWCKALFGYLIRRILPSMLCIMVLQTVSSVVMRMTEPYSRVLQPNCSPTLLSVDNLSPKWNAILHILSPISLPIPPFYSIYTSTTEPTAENIFNSKLLITTLLVEMIFLAKGSGFKY